MSQSEAPVRPQIRGRVMLLGILGLVVIGLLSSLLPVYMSTWMKLLPVQSAFLIKENASPILVLFRAVAFDKLRYSPLDISTDSFRLLVLNSGDPGDPISGALYHTSFSELPSYSALSYLWGTSEETKPIFVNGVLLNVRINLWHALDHLRHPQEKRVIWVDAICIDQNNENEKNHQIPLMALIYGRAFSVMVWLGEHHDIDDAVDLRAVASFASRQDLLWLGQPPFQSAEAAIGKLVGNAYWRRAWIIQEIGAAMEIEVHVGRQKMGWDQFMCLIELYQRLKPESRSVHYIRGLDRLRKSRYLDGEVYSLADLLSTFRNCFSSVRHDKIYAFLGLANDYFTDNTVAITVNYSSSLPELYHNVLRYQAHSIVDATEKQIEMVFMSGLVRQLLMRTSTAVRVKGDFILPNGYTRSFGIWKRWLEVSLQAYVENIQENEAKYHECLKDRDYERKTSVSRGIYRDDDKIHCEQQESGVWVFLLLNMISYPLIHIWCVLNSWVRLVSLRFWNTPTYAMMWHETTMEAAEFWLQPLQGTEGNDKTTVRGYIAGQIFHVGPKVNDILASFNTKKRWIASLPQYYSRGQDLQRMRGQNARLMNILEDPSGAGLRHIADFDGSKVGSAQERPPPRIFLGTGHIAGVAPPGAMTGDLICQLWNSSSSVILRRGLDGKYHIVGRSGMVQQGHSREWDVPQDKDLFSTTSQDAVDISVDIVTLTRLSFDTVNLPPSEYD